MPLFKNSFDRFSDQVLTLKVNMVNSEVEIETSFIKRNKRSHEGDQPKTTSNITRTIESSWIIDRREKIEVEFQWIVEDFSQKPFEQRITSPDFPAGFRNVHIWNLHLYPRRDKIAVYLWSAYYPRTFKTIPIDVEYEIILLNSQMNVLCHKDFAKHTFSFSKSNFAGYINCLEYELVQNGILSPSNELYVNCKIRYDIQSPSVTVHFNEKSQSLGLALPTENLTKKFQHLFNEEMILSDLEIQVKGQKFCGPRSRFSHQQPCFLCIV